MKKVLLSLLLGLSLIGNGFAQGEPLVPAVSSVFGDGGGKILDIQTDLQDYSQVDDFSGVQGGSTDPRFAGAYQIRNIGTIIIQFVEKMLVPIAVLLLMWGAISLLLNRNDEEKFKNTIRQVIWTGVGFLLFVLSYVIVDQVFFGVQGQVFNSPDPDGLAKVVSTEIVGLLNFASTFAIAIAVAYVVFGAIKLILLGENEEEQGKIRKQILFTILGILVISLINIIVSIFFSTDGGGGLNIDSSTLIAYITYWINILLGFIGLAAVISIIWAGIQMIINFGNEEAVNKSKKIIMFAIIGIVLAFSAFTIMRFFLTPGSFSNSPSEAAQLEQFDFVR